MIRIARSTSLRPPAADSAGSRRRRGRPLAVALAIGVAVSLVAPQAAQAGPIIVLNPIWQSAALETCAKQALGVAADHVITFGELGSLTSLTCTAAEVDGLSPLELATNLTSLDLRNNYISDISAVSTLTKLTYLDLRNNLVDSLPNLTKLTQLDEVYFDNNLLVDVSRLSGLKSTVDTISLTNNQVTSISPLKSFASISRLWLDQNRITNIDGLDEVVGSSSIVDISGQHLDLKTTTLGVPVAVTKVTGPTGASVPVKVSTSSQFGDPASKGKIVTKNGKKTVSWSTVGIGSLSWNTTFAFNGSHTAQYSGFAERFVLKKMKGSTPKITGTAKVGKTLKAKLGSWTKGADLLVTWLRDGKEVKYGHSTSYTLKSADKGHRIRVSVTGYKGDYLEVTKKSSSTAKVKK